MLKSDITIDRISEDTRYDPSGKSIPYLRVVFRVGNHGPFTEKFDKVDYNVNARDQKLESFAQTVRTT